MSSFRIQKRTAGLTSITYATRTTVLQLRIVLQGKIR